jgi:hypothetical protein
MSSFLNHTVAQRVRLILSLATTVTVLGSDVEPGPEAPSESFLVDHEPSTWTFPTMRSGTRSLETMIGLRVGVETHQRGLSSAATQARWFELADVVMDAIRADPTLQAAHGAITGVLGVVGEGEVRGPFTGALPDNTGWACLGDLLLSVRTRVC